MKRFACSPSAVLRFTALAQQVAGRNMWHVETFLASSLACVPFPAPGGPIKIMRTWPNSLYPRRPRKRPRFMKPW